MVGVYNLSICSQLGSFKLITDDINLEVILLFIEPFIATEVIVLVVKTVRYVSSVSPVPWTGAFRKMIPGNNFPRTLAKLLSRKVKNIGKGWSEGLK